MLRTTLGDNSSSTVAGPQGKGVVSSAFCDPASRGTYHPTAVIVSKQESTGALCKLIQPYVQAPVGLDGDRTAVPDARTPATPA